MLDLPPAVPQWKPLREFLRLGSDASWAFALPLRPRPHHPLAEIVVDEAILMREVELPDRDSQQVYKGEPPAAVDTHEATLRCSKRFPS